MAPRLKELGHDGEALELANEIRLDGARAEALAALGKVNERARPGERDSGQEGSRPGGWPHWRRG